jgi:hypothetical protein
MFCQLIVGFGFHVFLSIDESILGIQNLFANDHIDHHKQIEKINNKWIAQVWSITVMGDDVLFRRQFHFNSQSQTLFTAILSAAEFPFREKIWFISFSFSEYHNRWHSN